MRPAAGCSDQCGTGRDHRISATITRPELAAARPGIRFGLIDHALAPLEDTLGATDPARLAQLKLDLAAVVSADLLAAGVAVYGKRDLVQAAI